MGEPGTWGKYVLILLIIALPFMIYGATLDSFKNYYPIWWPARQGIGLFIIFELGVLLMMFNTEFYFRGILLFSLEKITIDFKHGRIFTLLLHSLIYMIVHIGKPGLEVPYSFFVGIVFAWLALRTRSIFPSLAAHWISSVMFDAFILIQQ